MQLCNDTVSIDELAAALGRRPSWLRRHWRRIHEEFGFPRKHPTGPTWPRQAVAAWLRAGGMNRDLATVPGAGGAIANDNAAGDHDAAYQHALDARYGGQP